jgi:hypothetical protein
VTIVGSNQRPARRSATSYAACTPDAEWKISTVWARHRIRASGGISYSFSPRGCPRPSQCSSSARIASAVRSDRPTRRAISAPRSQRASISDFVTSPSSRIASRRSTRVRTDRPGVTVRADHRNAANGLDQSIRFDANFAE